MSQQQIYEFLKTKKRWVTREEIMRELLKTISKSSICSNLMRVRRNPSFEVRNTKTGIEYKYIR